MTLAVTTTAAAPLALAMTMAVPLTVTFTATAAATVAPFTRALGSRNVSQTQEVSCLAARNDAVERSRSSISHESPSSYEAGGATPGHRHHPCSRSPAKSQSPVCSGAACIQDEHRTALTANQG